MAMAMAMALQRPSRGYPGSSSAIAIAAVSPAVSSAVSVAAPAVAGHDDMPVILHSVVGPAGEGPRDERPLVAVRAMGAQQPLLLLLAERPPVNPWVQLIEPSQAAALPCKISQDSIQNAEKSVCIYLSISIYICID